MMPTCRYFLQGTCRFGESCKFDHQIPRESNYARSGTSILLQSNSVPQTHSGSNVDTNTLLKSVCNDMSSAEKGGQWLLSTYAPFKEKPQFPGFEDQSMEEIRYLFYEAAKTGSVEQYKMYLQGLLQKVMSLIKTLQSPPPEVVHILRTIYNTPPSSNAGTFQGPGGNVGFQGSQPQNVFGAPANQSIFNIPQSPSQLAQNAGVEPSRSIFSSGTPSGNIFYNSGQVESKSIFGGAPMPAQNSNPLFGSNLPQQAPISGSTSIFAANVPQEQTVFGGQPQFGTLPQNSTSPLVQNALPPDNIFKTQGTANSFLPQAAPAHQQGTNVFGFNNIQSNVFGGNANHSPAPDNFYSKLEELSEEERQWFQSDNLDIEKIPEKPPAKELCF